MVDDIRSKNLTYKTGTKTSCFNIIGFMNYNVTVKKSIGFTYVNKDEKRNIRELTIGDKIDKKRLRIHAYMYYGMYVF